jgi:triosephosphate isomerase
MEGVMNKKLVVGNWKMHLTVPESTVLIEKLKKEVAKVKNVDVAICPSYLDIYPASKQIVGSKLSLGAQDVFYEEEGAYTGAVSPVTLSHFVKYVIVGHSERRRHFGETDKIVAKKAAMAVAHDIIPIICIGETLREKEEGLSKLVVMSQLETALSYLTASEIAEVVIAYEPVWAISTSGAKECKPDYAVKMENNIRALIKALYGEHASTSVRVIYGGNINETNANSFAKSKELDGVLVGAASRDHAKFSYVVKAFDSNATTKAKSTHQTDSTGSRQTGTRSAKKATK